MRKLVVVNILFLLSALGLAQGGWNIGYVQIDSIDASHIGTPVKLDFKRVSTAKTDMNHRTISTKFDVRSQVTPEDTAYILIGGAKTVLYEKRPIYIDWGFFGEQFLEIENNRKDLSERIDETEILEVEPNRIKVKATIRSYTVNGEETLDELKPVTREFWVEKDKLDGVMVKD